MEKYLPLILAIIAGLAFGSWPNIPSGSPMKIPTAMLTFSISIGILIVSIIQFFTTKVSIGEIQTVALSTTLKYIVAAVILNSIGYMSYAPLITLSKSLNTNIYLIIALVLTPVATYLYGVIFQNEILTLKNVLAMLFIIGGIVLLKTK